MNSDQQQQSQQLSQQFKPQQLGQATQKQPASKTASQDEVAQVAQLGYN